MAEGRSSYAGLDELIAANGSTTVWDGYKARLRAVELKDAEHELKNYGLHSADQRSGWKVSPPRSELAQSRWVEEAAAAQPEGDALQISLAIARRSDDVRVGGINIHTVNQINGTFMFGVGVAPDHKGNGYAAEAVLLILRYMFDERRFQKCESGCYDYNVASLALHRKLGFMEEGRLRRHAYVGGEYHDAVLFGMTVDEYRELYPKLKPQL